MIITVIVNKKKKKIEICKKKKQDPSFASAMNSIQHKA